jgi:hypothetical protein
MEALRTRTCETGRRKQHAPFHRNVSGPDDRSRPDSLRLQLRRRRGLGEPVPAAEDFKINRRVVFYNGITDSYILSIEGFCSVETEENNKLTVTCKVGNEYKKHFLGRSDNVTWFAEQLNAANVSTDHYKVFFKPSTIIPDVDVK